MSNKTIATIIVVIALAAGGYFAYQATQQGSTLSRPPQQDSNLQINPVSNTDNRIESTSSTEEASTESAQQSSSKVVVEITKNGYVPQKITINVGDTVEWVNRDTTIHTVHSDDHPTHLKYTPLNSVGNIRAGESKSFTFTEAGIYTYHDHLNPSLTGEVVVE